MSNDNSDKNMNKTACLVSVFLVYGFSCVCGLLLIPFIGTIGILVYLSFIASESYICVYSRRVNLIYLLLNILTCVLFLLFGSDLTILFLLIPLLFSALFVFGSQIQREQIYHVALVIFYVLLSTIITLYVLLTGFQFDLGLFALWMIPLVPTALFTLLLQMHKYPAYKKCTVFAIGFLGILVCVYVYCQLGVFKNLLYPLGCAFPGSV